jgi:hypothetical protein
MSHVIAAIITSRHLYFDTKFPRTFAIHDKGTGQPPYLFLRVYLHFTSLHSLHYTTLQYSTRRYTTIHYTYYTTTPHSTHYTLSTPQSTPHSTHHTLRTTQYTKLHTTLHCSNFFRHLLLLLILISVSFPTSSSSFTLFSLLLPLLFASVSSLLRAGCAKP